MCKREALHLVYDQDGTTVYPGPQIGAGALNSRLRAP